MREERPALLAGVAAFAVPLALYVATLAPSVTLEDSGELITAAYHLGVPHPSGYPLWCLVAHVFTWLPWGSVAERVHLSSAVLGAASAWGVYLCALRLVADWRAALVAAWSLAASTVLWSQSVVAEVYALNAFLSILLVYLVLRWRESRRRGWLYALALVTGLGLTNHHLIALVALPLFGWLLAIDHRAVLRVRVAAAGVLLVALGLSVYVYLPLRAAADPPLNVGNPRTIAAIVAHVRRDAYFGGAEAGRTAGTTADVLRHTGDAWRDGARSFGWSLAALALFGVVAWPRAQRDVLLATLAIALCNTLLLNVLLTAPHAPLWVYLHRVYYLPLHLMVALWIAAGAARVLRAGARGGVVLARGAQAALLLAVVAAALGSYPTAQHRADWIARNLALDLLDSAPPRAGFLPVGDEVLYPVLYARHVEGLRPDVHLISRQYGWHGEPYSMLLAGDEPSDQMRSDAPGLRDYVSVPRGLVFALVPRGQEAGDAMRRYASFVPLPGPPRDQGLENAGGDFFVDAVRARYAAYHARLGARSLARGDRAGGLASLDRAELLDPGDARVELLLARIYRELGVREERRRPLLERALASFDRNYDPHTARFDAVGRADIERELATLEPATSAPTSPGA